MSDKLWPSIRRLDFCSQRPAGATSGILHVEAASCGFLPDRRPIIRFERHIFHRLTGGRYDRSHPDICNPVPGNAAPEGAAQYGLLNEALSLKSQAALKSTS